MVQYVEHDTLVNELVTLENFSPEERLAHARKRRHEQIKSYGDRDRTTNLHPPHRASHNKKIRFDKNIELIEAASRNDFEEVEQLLTLNGVSADLQNDDGLSALHQAVIEDCQEVVETLINHGADLDIKDADLWTPLHAAVACGNYDLVKYLVDQGASLVEINTDGNMPIDLVEDMEEIEIFLDDAMAKEGFDEDGLENIRNEMANQMMDDLQNAVPENYDLNTQGPHGETSMHIAAANGYDEVVEYLLDHGAKINMLDHDAWQPIHAAACWGHDKIIEILVNHGADLDAVTNDGETPLDLTEDEDLQGMIIELKESGTKTRELKRSQSNSSRTLSVRRTSIVEKHRISVNDAKQEGIFRQNPDFLHVVISTGEEGETEQVKTEEVKSEQKNGPNTTVTFIPNVNDASQVNHTGHPQPPLQASTEEDGHTTSPDERQQISNGETEPASEGSLSMDLSSGVHYKPVEQRISIENDVVSTDQVIIKTQEANEPSAGKSEISYPEGKYTPISEDAGKEDANSTHIEMEIDTHAHSSHNTAAMKAKVNQELQQSADMSVKKKCCTIL